MARVAYLFYGQLQNTPIFNQFFISFQVQQFNLNILYQITPQISNLSTDPYISYNPILCTFLM